MLKRKNNFKTPRKPPNNSSHTSWSPRLPKYDRYEALFPSVAPAYRRIFRAGSFTETIFVTFTYLLSKSMRVGTVLSSLPLLSFPNWNWECRLGLDRRGKCLVFSSFSLAHNTTFFTITIRQRKTTFLFRLKEGCRTFLTMALVDNWIHPTRDTNCFDKTPQVSNTWTPDVCI